MMWVACAITQLAALSGPTLSLRRVPRAALLAQPRAAAPQLGLAVSLPGFGGGGSSGSSGPSEETLEYYRLFGLGEDATYDEINSKYDDLEKRYEGDTKMIIKLQVAKDKIFDDKLRQRMSGALGSAVKDPYANLGMDKKPLITIPPFLQEYIELPTRATLVENAVVFFVIGMLPSLSKGWASSSVGLGFAVGLYKLYNRGVPETNEMSAEMRPPKVKPVALAAGLTILFGAIGATLSQVAYGLLRSILSPESVIGLCISFSFFLSATFFKVQDEYF